MCITRGEILFEYDPCHSWGMPEGYLSLLNQNDWNEHHLLTKSVAGSRKGWRRLVDNGKTSRENLSHHRYIVPDWHYWLRELHSHTVCRCYSGLHQIRGGFRPHHLNQSGTVRLFEPKRVWSRDSNTEWKRKRFLQIELHLGRWRLCQTWEL